MVINIAVIGAGVIGLSAAYKILETTPDVQVTTKSLVVTSYGPSSLDCFRSTDKIVNQRTWSVC